MPPLRRRKEDIPQLVSGFVAELGKEGQAFSAEAIDRLNEHEWPGNIRELRTTVFRTLARSSAQSVDAADVLLDPLMAAQSEPMVNNALPTEALLGLLRGGPSKGASKKMLDALIGKYPEIVTVEKLQEVAGRSTPGASSPERLLQTKISQIRSALRRTDFEIEGPMPLDEGTGYRLVFVPHMQLSTGQDA